MIGGPIKSGIAQFPTKFFCKFQSDDADGSLSNGLT